MEEKIMNRAAERVWKHRFAQTLWEFLYLSGVPRAAALDDAYAYADAQYLVRGVESPEDEARSALSWIRPGETDLPANTSNDDAIAPNPQNCVRYIDNSRVPQPD